jgi:hypothetical protein
MSSALRPRLRATFPVGIAMVGAVLAGVSLAGCGRAEPPATSSAQPGSDSRQYRYQLAVLAEREVLFGGYIVAVREVSVPIDEPFTFTVRVCGTESTCALTAAPPPEGGEGGEGVGTSQGGGTAEIKVGGQVSATLTTDMPGQVDANTRTEQPIVTSTDEAEWEWRLRPSQDGQFLLTVHFSVLRQGSDEALLPDQKYVVPLTVRSTAGHTARSAWLGLKELIGLLSAAGVSLAAVVTWVVRRMTRRKRASAPTTANEPAGLAAKPASATSATSAADAGE